jgi:transketolase
MTGFGASAPAGELYSHYGITAEAVAAAADRAMARAMPATIAVPA